MGHLRQLPYPGWRLTTYWPPARPETPGLGWKGKWIETLLASSVDRTLSVSDG